MVGSRARSRAAIRAVRHRYRVGARAGGIEEQRLAAPWAQRPAMPAASRVR